MSSVSDQDIARAQALGRLAARARLPISKCPYPRTARVLRMRYVLAYTGAGGRVGVEGSAARAGARVRRWWNGPDDD
jgi:hypothetical protein